MRLSDWTERLHRTKSRSELIRHYTITRSAHTPKPEKMYEALIRAGLIWIERRRFKPPRIVWVERSP